MIWERMEDGAERVSKDSSRLSPTSVPVPVQGGSIIHVGCVSCHGAPNWCRVVPVGRERDGMEGRHGGGYVPLNTSCAVGRGEVGECG